MVGQLSNTSQGHWNVYDGNRFRNDSIIDDDICCLRSQFQLFRLDAEKQDDKVRIHYLKTLREHRAE